MNVSPESGSVVERVATAVPALIFSLNELEEIEISVGFFIAGTSAYFFV